MLANAARKVEAGELDGLSHEFFGRDDLANSTSMQSPGFKSPLTAAKLTGAGDEVALHPDLEADAKPEAKVSAASKQLRHPSADAHLNYPKPV